MAEYSHPEALVSTQWVADGNFHLGIRQFGLAPLMTLLQRYGLPKYLRCTSRTG